MQNRWIMSLETGDFRALEIPLSNAVFVISLKKLIQSQCFQVNAIDKEAKNVALYKCAEEHQACYSLLGRSKSIWYDIADLHIYSSLVQRRKQG
jgi:hypothetical protein